MRRITLLIAALAALLAAAAPANAANVALFNDTTYVGNAESANMQAVLVSQGHTVFTFTDESAAGIASALDGRSSLIIPDLAGGTDLHTALSPSARQVIREFVENGGGFVINGRASGDEAANLINTLFNFEVTESLTANPSARNQSAAGTEFAGGPDTLVANNTTSGLDLPTLPSGANPAYVDTARATVGILFRGRGSITYLGWDWNNSNPPTPGGQDSGWQGILNSAVAFPTLNVADVGVSEGNAGITPAQFAATLSGPVSEEVRITYEFAGGTATPGQDYTFGALATTIPRGTTSATIDAQVIGDGADEPNETFELRLIGAGGAGLVRTTALGTIGDDDPSPGRCANRQDANDTGDTLNGTGFGDLLVGGNGRDVLNGAGGDDCLRGRAGSDRLSGGDGNDSVSGEAGNDRASGGEGKDSVSGGAGNDTISGGNGNDRLGGGAGNDKINGGQGLNTYSGGAGNDNIVAANGRRETVDCGSGSKDKVRADRTDNVRNCESVQRL
jgi:Ca2+-binding RTX toxin-like protein